MRSERPSTLNVEEIDHLVLNVRDVEVSADWYCRVLGMDREDVRIDGMARTSVRFGRTMINLRPLTASQREWFTALHSSAGNHDLCFLTRCAPDAVREHLEGLDVAIEAGPGPRRGARGEIISVYCRDPEGSLVEIASYAGERRA